MNDTHMNSSIHSYLWVTIALLFFCTTLPAYAKEDLETLIQKGNEAFEKGNYEASIKIYEKGLKAAPTEAVLYYNKGNALFRLEKFEDALDMYNTSMKNNPKKVLLKNIYFNTGNTHYRIAENKITEEGADIEKMKEALGSYENAFDMYKKSLELERKISIANGTDIHKAGVYAKQNWALARDAWTSTWEKIREIEKKNLKLEDGIKNLLQSQKDLLPRLESFYLYSFSEDSLKFNMKTLAQYQIDYQEDIQLLQTLAKKEVERAFAELENYKASKKESSDQDQQTPLEDPELKKLQGVHEDSEKLQIAVDTATGLMGWIIDGLNRGDPIQAWKNSKSMVRLLREVKDYLDKSDHIKIIYQETLQDLAMSSRLVSAAVSEKYPEDKGGFEDVKSRLILLVSGKLEISMEELAGINEILNKMAETLEKSEAPPESEKPQEAPAKEKNKAAVFFEQASKEVTKASIQDVMDRNTAVSKKIEAVSQKLKQEDPKTTPSEFETIISDTVNTVIRYEQIHTPLISMFATMIKASESVIDSLEEVSDSVPENTKPSENKKEATLNENGKQAIASLSLMEVLLFKYVVLIDHTAKNEDEELAPLRQYLPVNLQTLETAWKEADTARGKELTSVEDINALKTKITSLRLELLKSMTLLSPDAAISLYFERVKSLQSKIIESTPSTRENKEGLQKRYGQVGSELKGLHSILSQYFEQTGKAIEKVEDKEKKAALKKSATFRKSAMDKLDHSDITVRDTYELLEKENFLSTDLLSKDLLTTFDKSHITFLGKPDDAKKALEASIAWQKFLKKQTGDAVETERKEGNSGILSKYLTQNQTDIMTTTGLASRLIREMMEESGPSKDDPQSKDSKSGLPSKLKGLLNPPNQEQKQDPKKLKEAIQYIQDALIEAQKIHSFFGAKEFKNTESKHDQVIELLEKALEALKSKQDQSCDNKNQDQQNQQQKDQSQQDQQNQGNQGSQKKQKPLELTPEQARELLNQLNKQDEKGKKAKGKRVIDAPRPW